MFIIIGGDGKEYGPVTSEQVRAWVAAGRANLDTRAKALGTDEWRRLADFGEFTSPDGAPPVMAGGTASGPVIQPYVTADGTVPGDLAGVGSRLGAALINAVFYFIAIMPGSVAFARQLLADNPDMARGVMPDLAVIEAAQAEHAGMIAGGLLGAMLLQCILIVWRGQNLGKLLTGARVVRTSGEPAGFLRGVLLRYVIPVGFFFLFGLVPFGGFLFLLVDFCFIFREDRRCLHDLMAGTKVVRA